MAQTLPAHGRVVVRPPFPSREGGAAYRYPHEVVADQTIPWDRKREILSAWASDANAVESFPTLRHMPGTPHPVTLSSILDALVRLDPEQPGPAAPAARRPAASFAMAA